MKKCVDASSVRGGGARGPPRPPHPPAPPRRESLSVPPPPRAAAVVPPAPQPRAEPLAETSRTRKRAARGVSEASSAPEDDAPAPAPAPRARASASPLLSVSAANLGGGTRMARAGATGARCAAGAPRRRGAWCSSAPPNAAAPRRPAATASPSSPRPVFPEKNPSPKNRPPARVSRATFEREAAFASSLMIFSVSTELRSLRSRVSRLFLPGSFAPGDRRAAGPPPARRGGAPARAPARRASR